MKKRFFLFWALILFNAICAHAYDFFEDGIYYNRISGTQEVEVTYDNDYYSSTPEYVGTIVIPSTVTHSDITYSVTRIGNSAFYGCTNLTQLTIPESVVQIGSYAFYGCAGLTQLTIPESVVQIGSYAFYGCAGLTQLTIPEGVAQIEDSTFSGCAGLTQLTIPEGVVEIGYSAFYGCVNLENVSYNAVYATTNDYSSPFANCPSLSTINIGENVEVISPNIFKSCTGLLSITIPEKVTSIGFAAFSGCTALTTVNYNAINATTPSRYDVNNTYIFDGCTSLSTVTFGENVETIPDYMFRNRSSLTGTLTIPNSVTSIGNYAFSGCSGLTGTLTIPSSVTSIGFDAFSDCNINTVNYDAIDAAGGGLFARCSLLSTVNIGENVKTIPNDIFSGCTALSSLTIPEGITSIGDFAFSGCFALSSLTIPESIISIGGHAFFQCLALSSLTIPEGITSIGEYAFDGCTSLTTVNYNAINCTIDSYYSIFHYCTSLATVNIGENVKTIPAYLFGGIPSLTSLTISEGVTSIGTNAFYGSMITGALQLPSTLTVLGRWAFYNCRAITSITIPENLTTIEEGTFSGCSGLTAITLPESVTSVGESAFRNCSNLSSVTVMNSTPPLCASNTFDGVDVYTCVLHVPAGSKSAYENAKGWRDFTHIMDDIGVTKQGQTINFPSFTGKTYGDATVTLPATTNSGLTIHYESSNPQVATVSGNILTIVRAGTTNITASQDGNGSYLPAEPVIRTLTVNKATLTITADNKTRPYGEANPSFTLSYTGFKHNETAGVLQQLPAINCTAGVNSPVGSYTITLSGGSDTNYDYQFVTGRLEIIKAGQSISFGAISTQTYGNRDILLPLTTDKGLTIRYESSNSQVATVSGNILTIVGIGTSNITASQGGNENYLPAAPVIQTLFVNAKNMSHSDIVVASITGQVYRGGSILPEPTVIDNGRLLVKAIDYVCSYSNNVNAGTATITIYGIGNYVGNKNVYFEIQKASQSINFPELTDLAIGKEYLLQATATSGLPVRYVVDDQSIASVIQKGNNTVLAILGEGQTFITALQDGNTNYHAAEPVGQVVKGVSSTSLIQPKDQGIQVYPTLVKTGESVYIKTPRNVILGIYNMSGALVNNISITEGVTPVMIPYVSGIYLFRMTDAEKRSTVVKVMVK